MSNVLDDLPRIAIVLDADGRITGFNDAWTERGRARGLARPTAWLGRSYLDVTWRAARARVEGARKTGQTIERVLAGDLRAAEVGYPCDAADAPAWKTVAVRGLPTLGGALLIHFDAPDPRGLHASDHRLTEIAFRLIFGIETRCAWCHRIASASGAWREVAPRDGHRVSDGLCPSCDERMVAALDRRAVAIA